MIATSSGTARHEPADRPIGGVRTAAQRWGIRAGVPRGWTVAHKNGWASLSQFGFVTNSVGFVADPAGGGYAIAIFTVGHLGLTDGRQMVEAIARQVSSQLAP